MLSTSASSVSAHVGYYVNFNTMDTVKVRIRAYNADDVLQAESPYVTVTENTPLTQQVTATAPSPTIDYFEIVADGGDMSEGKSIAFDDLTIVTPDPLRRRTSRSTRARQSWTCSPARRSTCRSR